MTSKNIITKKDEVIIRTANARDMYGKYLAKPVRRCWIEDFVDEDCGEVVSIERFEVVANAGTFLDNDIIPQIMFYIEAEDVKEVIVSNQKREAVFVKDQFTSVWNVTIEVNQKKVKLFLYAYSASMAIEVAKDFVELNYSGLCKILQVKEFGSYIMIEDTLQKTEEKDSGKKYYKIETKIISDENIHYYNFIVHSTDVDASMIVINNWLSKFLLDNKSKSLPDFTTITESAAVIPCTHIIEKEFSEAYIEEVQ